MRNYAQLSGYTIDEKTNLNDSELSHILINERKSVHIPTNYSQISLYPNLPMSLSEQ
ncbi:unnamed protein product, partial [Rotaria sp. Silwood1]